jgi:hypothetical protein
MNDSQKLAHVLTELKRVTLPDRITKPQEYWNAVEVRCDNATDEICEIDIFHKQLIQVIES